MLARTWMLTLAAAALVAGPAAGLARADDQHDELAEGDWEGKAEFKGASVAGGGTVTPPDPAPVSPPPPTGTPTEPTNPPEPEPTPAGPSTPYPEKPKPGPGTPPWTSMPCPATWDVEVEPSKVQLVDKQTLLTMTLLRTDAFGFLCNLYARAESTWYIDWFATTAANEQGNSKFAVTLKITGACPSCSPHIAVEGNSILEARAQIKALFGGTDSSTMGTSQTRTQWAAPVDCTDDCNVTAKAGSASSKYGVGFAGAEIENTETKAYVYGIALGGKSAVKEVKGTSARVSIVDSGAVAVYAGGANDNAQAKSRAGYWLHLKGVSNCGSWGEYVIEVKD